MSKPDPILDVDPLVAARAFVDVYPELTERERQIVAALPEHCPALSEGDQDDIAGTIVAFPVPAETEILSEQSGRQWSMVAGIAALAVGLLVVGLWLRGQAGSDPIVEVRLIEGDPVGDRPEAGDYASTVGALSSSGRVLDEPEFRRVVRQWGKQEPEAAIRYTERSAPGTTLGARLELRRDLLSDWAERDLKGALVWAQDMPQGALGDWDAMSIVLGAPEGTGLELGPLVRGLQPGQGRAAAAGLLANKIYVEFGPEVLMGWAEATSEDEIFQQGIIGVSAEAIAREDVPTAIEWVATIDPALSGPAAAAVANQYAQNEPGAAADWVAGLVAADLADGQPALDPYGFPALGGATTIVGLEEAALYPGTPTVAPGGMIFMPAAPPSNFDQPGTLPDDYQTQTAPPPTELDDGSGSVIGGF